MGDKLADMVEKLVLDNGYYLPRRDIGAYRTLAELVQDTFDFLVNYSKVSRQDLTAMAKGEQPSEVDLLRLGIALKMAQGELDDLYHRSFQGSTSGKKK